MINKFSFFIFIILISLSFVSAFDIAYIVKDTANPEANIIDAITEAGYDYELIDDSKILSTDFEDYEMILVWDEVLSDYDKIPITETRSLIGAGRSSYLDYWGIADYTNNLGSNGYDSGVILLEHEISGNLEGTIQLYNDKGAKVYVLPLSYRNRAPGLERIVSNSDRTLIGAIDSGGELYGGGIAEERIVFFGISETEFWTQESKDLFKNSLSWLIKEDKDLDGFFDDDCDDNNPEINPNAEELIDDIDQNCVNDEPVLIRGLESIAWTIGNIRQIYLEDYFADPEGDDLIFSIHNSSGGTNINVDMNNGLVSFSSADGWIGEDWVVFKAEDSNGGERLTDEIVLRVLASNSAPVLNDYSPKGSVRISKGVDKTFSVSVFDVEGFVDILWFLDGVNVESGSSYVFNQERGTYSLEAYVSDGEYDVNRIWNVFVGDISELTCQEAEGYTCSNSEYCILDNLLGVKDSDDCCSVPCSPKFRDVDRCDNIDSEIEIEIQDPGENEEFKVGEIINGRLKIKNNLEDLDFDVEVYLYDISEDEEVLKYETSVEIDKDREKILRFEFEVPENLDEENDYAIFAKVIEEDEEYCNEKYIRIDIIREEHDVVIESVKVDDSVVCGDYIYVDVKVKNLGSSDEEVYLVVENSELDIYEETEEFDLERYGDEDEFERRFEMKIPNEIEEGTYEIEIDVFFDVERNSFVKDLFVKCDWVEEEIVELEDDSEEGDESRSRVFVFLLIMSFVLMISLLGFYVSNSDNKVLSNFKTGGVNGFRNLKSGALSGFDKLKGFSVGMIKTPKKKAVKRKGSKGFRIDKKSLMKLKKRVFG